VKFAVGEKEAFAAAASAAGLRFNAWVRRACREQAALEAALARQDADVKVGLERQREGWYRPVGRAGAPGLKATFKPDFK
jgi:hypothetical protein